MGPIYMQARLRTYISAVMTLMYVRMTSNSAVVDKPARRV